MRLQRGVLEPLRAGQTARYVRYHWPTDAYGQVIEAFPAGVVLVEGVTACRLELSDAYDLRIWVRCSMVERLRRGLARDAACSRRILVPGTHRPQTARQPALLLKGQALDSQNITLDVTNAARYYILMIRSFKGKAAERVFARKRHRALSAAVQRAAYRKLLILDAAQTLDDLRIPPGNRLERLRGDREGQHSIRINQQWRICFRWRSGNAHDVEIVDYH